MFKSTFGFISDEHETKSDKATIFWIAPKSKRTSYLLLLLLHIDARNMSKIRSPLSFSIFSINVGLNL